MSTWVKWNCCLDDSSSMKKGNGLENKKYFQAHDSMEGSSIKEGGKDLHMLQVGEMKGGYLAEISA